MITEVNLKLKTKYVSKYRTGYPLLQKEALINIQDLKTEGTILNLRDDKNKFIAKGYYGRQNKGYGWVLTTNEQEEIDAKFFKNKLKTALEKRNHFFKEEATTAFRLFNGEGDGLGGLTIDYFAGVYLLNWYSKGIFTFQEPIVRALQELVDYRSIYQKKRFAESGKYIEEDSFLVGERIEGPLIVKENGIKFAIYLDEGAMVGVFLDQRNVRKTLRDKYVKGKRVLNTFSYTGAFSIAAALGGAFQTTSVDLANRSLPKTKEHFEINGLDSSEHAIIVEDVFNYFKYAVKKNLSFDVVILDPPSFAKSKKYIFSATKDYKNLLKEAIAITKDEGIIVASTNCSELKMGIFKSFVENAFQEMGEKYRIMEEFSLPEDFRTSSKYPEGNYLKVLFIKKISFA